MKVDAAGYAAALRVIHANACSVIKATLPEAVVLNRFIRPRNPRDLPPELISENYPHPDTGRPRIFAVCVSFIGALNGDSRTLQSLSSKPVFHFAFYREYDEGDDLVNSGLDFMDMCIMCRFNLWAASDLGDKSLVQGHEQLILPPEGDLIQMSDRQSHYLGGSLTVLMQAAQKA